MCSRRHSTPWSCWDRTRIRSSYSWATRVTSFTRCVICTSHSISQSWITRVTSMGNLWTITIRRWTKTSLHHSHHSSTFTRSCRDPFWRTSTTDIASPNWQDPDPRCIHWLMRSMWYTMHQREFHIMWQSMGKECVWRISIITSVYVRCRERKMRWSTVNSKAFTIRHSQLASWSKPRHSWLAGQKRWILDDNVHILAFGHYRLVNK